MTWQRDEPTTLEELEEQLRDKHIVEIKFSEAGKPRRVSVTACAILDELGTTCYVHGAGPLLEDALNDVEVRVEVAKREELADSEDWEDYPITREHS